VPDEILEKAAQRGQMVHEVIQCYEEKVKLPPRTADAQERVKAYLRWKDKTGFIVCGPMERSIVYEHLGTGCLVGGTPDLIGRIGNDIWVVDLKTCFRQSGKAKQMKTLEWRLQTQSYFEALQEDEPLWRSLGKSANQMKRAVLHLHPDCGIEKRGEERLGYEWNVFEQDDTDNWASAVRLAALKLANGHKRPDRN
jgi:hypothetical protein